MPVLLTAPLLSWGVQETVCEGDRQTERRTLECPWSRGGFNAGMQKQKEIPVSAWLQHGDVRVSTGLGKRLDRGGGVVNTCI